MMMQLNTVSVAVALWWCYTVCCAVEAYRLPEDLRPINYQLRILTNLGDEGDRYDFSGNVTIQIHCVAATRNITLHAKKLTIDEANIKVTTHHDDANNDARMLRVRGSATDAQNDFFTIELEDEMEPEHEYDVAIGYRGKLEDALAGFYRSTYEDKATKAKRYLATTQFEATDARRAFPCFDEPAMKATYDVTMGHHEKYTALSNMPAQNVTEIDGKAGWVWTQFERTVPMSTYLVAFVVFDFGHKEAQCGNVTFNIWSRKDALNQVEMAKTLGPQFLRYFEDFFALAYPLPKMDMVAIPDFAAGAMENWGLITYREAYLLHDADISSSSSAQSVASVIAHELAHQWFGNLVTMRWWTDLWLNEGFATYMAALAVHHVHPEWKSLDEEVADNLLSVFAFDSLKSSHPISVPVGHPKEIDEIFDTISYKKGSYILRMMTLFLGAETLRDGVRKYLVRHKYNNAEQDDLWQALTEQAHQDKTLPSNLTVKRVMDTWTLQTGYPVVNVNRLYDGEKIEVEQKRFLRDVVATKDSDKVQCWWVPLSYTNEQTQDFNDTKPKSWLPCDDSNHKMVIGDETPSDKWVLFNIQAAGLYKVNYDTKNWHLLIDYLNGADFANIPVLNRVQLIDDSAYLAWTGDLDYAVHFGLLAYLHQEPDYLPWKAALRNVATLNRQLKRSGSYGLFKEYMNKLLTPIYSRVGQLSLKKSAESLGLDEVKHQTQIAAWACRFNVADCVDDARKKFEAYQNNPRNHDLIPKDLRSVIYCTAIQYGGEKEWTFLWQQYLHSNVATEKNAILDALGCTREIWLLQRYLDWALKTDQGIRKQDYSTVFGAVATNDIGYYIAQKYFENNLEKIHAYLSPNARRLSRCFGPLASQMVAPQDYTWFRNLTEHHAGYFKESKQGVDRSLEVIQLNIQWQKQHANDVQQLLEDKVKK